MNVPASKRATIVVCLRFVELNYGPPLRFGKKHTFVDYTNSHQISSNLLLKIKSHKVGIKSLLPLQLKGIFFEEQVAIDAY